MNAAWGGMYDTDMVMLCLSVFTDLSPILLVIACALLGIGAKKITGSVRKEGEGK